MTGGWTTSLWDAAADSYAAILRHPFLLGLTDGSLDRAAFTYFLAQDAHYLRRYAQALAVLAAKAPTHADTGMLAGHSAQTAAVEVALHEQLLPALGVAPEALAAVAESPTTTAYTSYLLAVCYGGTFAEGLAAVLPCYWIYHRVGNALAERGSPDPHYQQWIDAYASEGFAATVAEVLALADRTAPLPGTAETDRARAHFVTTARYEWMFWDAAWRREQWPLSAATQAADVAGIDHVTVTASDLAAGLAFYDAALGALGWVRTVELGDEEEDGAPVEVAGWGPQGEDEPRFWLVLGDRPSRAGHVALRARCRSEVEAFHRAALAAGGGDHDPPRRWPIFRVGQFNAVVTDPDGNLVEAVAPE